MTPNIVLTGFMGTGKTTVGRLLAARLGRDFVDTDEVVIQRSGRAIADIFREEGQAAFRRWEAIVAQELAAQEGLVIATGGRLLLDPDNAAALSRHGIVFCLAADPAEIIARLALDEQRRPLLDVPDPEGRVYELLQRRADAYGRFPQISTGGKTPAEVAEEIINRLQEGTISDGNINRLSVTHPHGRYDVIVGRHLLPQLAELAGIAGPIVVVTDNRVGPLYAAQCQPAAVITIPAGEQHKTLEIVRTIYDELLAVGLDRKGTVVALGGGGVGDVAGFVAATYMRGVNFVQCPTTLLAMVDASVGGKTGVDLPQGKNLIGAFKQPAAVVADLATLETLPPAEFAAGMAEVIKHGLIAGSELWQRLETERPPLSDLQSLILHAVQVKRDIVQEDPFEQGRRAVLNLGHTFAHAIEQVSGYAVRHGEAVAMGLVAAAHLSQRLGHCSPGLPPRIEAVLAGIPLPTRIPAGLPAEALWQAMGSDKKKTAGRLRFVLLRDVGDVFVTADVPEAAVLASLRACTHSSR